MVLEKSNEMILTIIENDLPNSIKKPFTSFHDSKIRSIWVKTSKLFTIFIPEKYIPGNSKQAKIAWREKVMLCFIILSISCFLLTYLTIIPSSMCPATNVISLRELSEKPHYNPHVIIHGTVYDFTEFAQKHFRGDSIPHHIFDFAGKDASALFPKPINSKSINEYRKSKLVAYDMQDSSFHPFFHSWQDFQITSNWPDKYDLCFTWAQIKEASGSDNAWISINAEIFNVSELIQDVQFCANRGTIESEILDIFNDINFKAIISAPWGRDKTDLFNYPRANDHYENLLKGYRIGVIDYRESIQCKASNFIMLASTGIVVLVILVKFFASLQLGIKKEPEKISKNVIILVPCYSEDKENLKRSIDSIACLDYENRRKILIMVADGNVTGRGNSASTPALLKTLLGVNASLPVFTYQSVSSEGLELNKAELHFGFYESNEKSLPFILIIKIGCGNDPMDSGNRGKRDSQLIILRFFSKITYNLPLNPLELELYRGFLEKLEIDPLDIEFALMVDADTELFSDSLNRLLACCVHDSKIIGICGETRIRNEKTSWITMIQVYEYFISHHMSKSFESLFGCVTCLPGCFCLYRLKNSAENMPLLIQKDLIDDYSQTNIQTLHQKNLLSLGEDRYLTTLALKYFPSYRTKFTPDAVCLTFVPESWQVLLSQRRRWINSTIHNLLELLVLPNLCGFCLFSMRFIIFMDLFSTIILPSTVLYMFFLTVKTFENNFSAKISLVMICSVYGLQTLIFMIKKQWNHVGWMLIYIMAMPIFGFFIPLYSFWHFDDFSWGRTRILKDQNAEIPNETGSIRKSNDHLVLKTWDEYLAEINYCIPFNSVETNSSIK